MNENVLDREGNDRIVECQTAIPRGYAAPYFEEHTRCWHVAEISARGWFCGYASRPFPEHRLATAEEAVVAYALQQEIAYTLKPITELRMPR